MTDDAKQPVLGQRAGRPGGVSLDGEPLVSRVVLNVLWVDQRDQHGADREGGDLDLLVDPLPGATLLDLGRLHAELEDLLGVRVDLLTPGDLPACSLGIG